MRNQTIKAITPAVVGLAVFFNLLVPTVLAQSNGKRHSLRGFSDESAAEEIRWEEKYVDRGSGRAVWIAIGRKDTCDN